MHHMYQRLKKSNRELKSRRVSIACKPSTVEAMEKLAFMMEVSVNEVLNRALSDFASANHGLIKQYDEMGGEKANN